MLTPKQENFCQKYLELGNASEAYRQSYSAGKSKPETVARTAKALLDNPKIAARLDELKAKIEKRHAITVDALVDKLGKLYDAALTEAQIGAGVSAVMGIARLSGLDKQVVEVVAPQLIIRRPGEL